MGTSHAIETNKVAPAARVRRAGFVLGLVVLLLSASGQSQPVPTMTAHFVDVGQAHATILEFPCGLVLVDAGAQNNAYRDGLIAYLDNLFQRRADLQDTVASIIITHNHLDHTHALRAVVEAFTVENYIDNGQLTGGGAATPRWVRDEVQAGRQAIQIREVAQAEIEALPEKTGLTDAAIDPVACSPVDPEIRILSGRHDVNPGWSTTALDNRNNHSLVTRVDFGFASFIFTGDLEDVAIEHLLEYYEQDAPWILNADVYQVGHHGSHNGTTSELLTAMTPRIAVIPVGPVIDDQGGMTAFAFGHPRTMTIDLLEAAIDRNRSTTKTFRAAVAARTFVQRETRRAIYATAWDGTVRIRATAHGTMTVFRSVF